jgi:hypothetical protein
MLMRGVACVIILLVAISAFWATANGNRLAQEITKSEEQEARKLATQFINEFAESKDLAPVVEHLYVRDFIQRFNQSKLKHPEMSPDLYFMPGLEYDPALLAQGAPEDWQHFYISENTFVFLGFIYGWKKIFAKGEDIQPTDLYPQSVIELLNQNPNLSNVIKRKGRGKPISSIEQLRKATEVLQQAATIMREKTPAKLHKKELLNVMKDKMFKPQFEIGADEEYFGVSKNSRIIMMKTPILFFLMFVRENNQLRILCAIPYTGD